jgi:16S rRNA processing protein RimM
MLIGRVAGAFGIRGEVKVEIHTDYPERFAALETAFIGPEHTPHLVESARLHAGHALLRLAGVGTRDQAHSMRGLEVTVPRAHAVDLQPGHYYLDELVGFQVTARSGQSLGTVSEVLRTGSNDVYVVGSGRSERLIPGIAAAIGKLDFDAREILVEDWVLAEDHDGV